jgi:hypothetical protein
MSEGRHCIKTVGNRIASLSAGIFSSTLPTLTDGQKAELQLGSRGELIVNIRNANSAPSGVDNPADAYTNSIGRLFTFAALSGFNGSTWDRIRIANVFKTRTDASITAGTPATIWTPSSGKKFRLLGLSLSLSVAGQIIFKDGGAADAVILMSPKLAAAGIWTIGRDDIGNGLLGAAADGVLKVDVSGTGNVGGSVWGTEE